MKPSYWLVLAITTVGATQAAACSSSSNSCEDTRTCATADAGAGQGEAGEAAGGDSGGEPGGNAEAGRNDGGASGEAGAGSNATPMLFGECSTLGATACQGQASAQRLACDGQKWQAGTTCAEGKLCDSATGECATQVADCIGVEPKSTICVDDTPVTCGPDLITEVTGEECSGLCTDGVCQAPTCGDKKVEAGEDCDDGTSDVTGSCVNCKKATCGDGVVHAGAEECDDGNMVNGDGCSSTCTWEPVGLALGDNVTCALSANGNVKCWGYNGYGTLGLGDTKSRGDLPNEMGRNLSAISLGTNRTAKSIAAGVWTVCAFLDDGGLKCWGHNDAGQLGTGDKLDRGSATGQMGDNLSAIQFSSGEAAASVGIGESETCAVLNTGSVKCWGSGDYGQLGLNDTLGHLAPVPAAIYLPGGTAKAVSASPYSGFACALFANATEECWGSNNLGELSVNTTSNIGDQALETNGLAPLNFGPGRTVKAIGNGTNFACALLDDSSVRCWGYANFGAIGRGAVKQAGTTPAELAVLPAIDLGTGRTAKTITVGSEHVCAILDNGDLKCWGANSFGQLGIGDKVPRGNMQGQMGDALIAVQLGTGRRARQVVAGEYHTCALLDDGTVKCWGQNQYGALGTGDTVNLGSLPGQMGDALKPIDLAF